MMVIWDRTFDHCWEELGKRGYCDSEHGAEYARVKELWIRQNGPLDPFLFILDNANDMPLQSFPHTDVSQLFEKGGQ